MSRRVAHRERELPAAGLDEVVVVAADLVRRQRRRRAVERGQHRRPPRQPPRLDRVRCGHFLRARAVALRFAPQLEVLEPHREQLGDVLERVRLLAGQPGARDPAAEDQRDARVHGQEPARAGALELVEVVVGEVQLAGLARRALVPQCVGRRLGQPR